MSSSEDGDERMRLATIQQIIVAINESVAALGHQADDRVLEDMALLVHEAMGGGARVFHGPSHIFSLAGSADPIHRLSAFFHDIVYFQVDGGFAGRIAPIVEPIIQMVGED